MYTLKHIHTKHKYLTMKEHLIWTSKNKDCYILHSWLTKTYCIKSSSLVRILFYRITMVTVSPNILAKSMAWFESLNHQYLKLKEVSCSRKQSEPLMDLTYDWPITSQTLYSLWPAASTKNTINTWNDTFDTWKHSTMSWNQHTHNPFLIYQLSCPKSLPLFLIHWHVLNQALNFA